MRLLNSDSEGAPPRVIVRVGLGLVLGLRITSMSASVDVGCNAIA